MCFTEKKSKRHYEVAASPPRPVLAPVIQSQRYERPRKAPMVPPDRQTRKTTEARAKNSLRQAIKVEANRQGRMFSPSNNSADQIRARALAKAKQNRSQAPQAVNTTSDYPKPLNIRKKAPQPQRSFAPADLGNTTPAFRHAGPDQSNIHPAFRDTARNTVWPGPGANTHPALSFGSADQSEIHPALRTRAFSQTRSREASISQSDVERDILDILDAYSSHDDEISPLNVTQRLPYSRRL